MTTDDTNLKSDDLDDIVLPQPISRPATLFSPKIKLGIVFGLVAAGLGFFAFSAFSGATISYTTVANVAGSAASTEDKQVGIVGKLVHDSYVRSPDGLTAVFSVVDEGGSTELQVKYVGEINQVFFNDHSELDMRGQLGPDRVFSTLR